MVWMLSRFGDVSMPVVGIDVKKVTEVVGAAVAESDSVCGAFVDAIGERSIAAVELDKKCVIEIGMILVLERDHMVTLVALNFAHR